MTDGYCVRCDEWTPEGKRNAAGDLLCPTCRGVRICLDCGRMLEESEQGREHGAPGGYLCMGPVPPASIRTVPGGLPERNRRKH